VLFKQVDVDTRTVYLQVKKNSEIKNEVPGTGMKMIK
jgi:hypothetical protein